MAIIDVVKHNGNPDIFAWKFPNNELATWTQLIVNESQEAILFKDGQVCDLFTAGKYTLHTKNIPILNKLINIPFGGDSPFIAEVWFINKVFSLDIKWGTQTPIQLQDPKYNLFIPIKAYGQFGINIINPKEFLFKLVGNLPIFDKDNIINYFKGLYLTKVKDIISNYIINKKISILEINAYLSEISEFTRHKIIDIFKEFGINLNSFYINDISTYDNDQSVITLKRALAKKAEMEIIGFNYQQERSFDTLEGAAKNRGSTQSSIMGAGIGMAMGVGLGNTFNEQLKNLNITGKKTKICNKCNKEINFDSIFCPYCGNDIDDNSTKYTCNKCGYVTKEKFKFCPECGEKFLKLCENCKKEININSKFCPECGYKLI